MNQEDNHQRFAAVRTGDILLFSGWCRTAMILRTYINSMYTHTAVAVWLKTSNGRRLYCYDAGPLREKDTMSPNYAKKVGVRLFNISKLTNRYSQVHYRPINVVRNNEFYLLLKEFMHEFHYRSFRPSLQLIRIHSCSSSPEGTGIYCTELCSAWLERLGLLSSDELRDRPHWKSTPRDIADSSLYTGAFRGNTMVVYDEGTEHNIRGGLVGLLILGLMVYIVITVLKSKR